MKTSSNDVDLVSFLSVLNLSSPSTLLILALNISLLIAVWAKNHQTVYNFL